jgi:hypothetical protein
MNITEFQCDGYTVTSYGSGIAYFIARNEKEGFFVQGDDAAMLREQTGDFTNSRIFSEYFAATGQP